jgi:hypothetical protein
MRLIYSGCHEGTKTERYTKASLRAPFCLRALVANYSVVPTSCIADPLLP